jgi:hypothetical protein
LAGEKLPSARESVILPVGYEDPVSGEVTQEAEVRAVTGGDELYIGMSAEYNKYPNDLTYKTVLLSRVVTRLGSRTSISIDDIRRLHAKDLRALEYAVYAMTYGTDAIPEPDGPSG